MATERTPIPHPFFVDIETVPQYEHFKDAPEQMQKCFEKTFSYKINKLIDEPKYAHEKLMNVEAVLQRIWVENAGVTAEYGKIICISIGKFTYGALAPELRIKTLFDQDEQKLLIQFRAIINKTNEPDKVWLCAHNGKEFDFPYLFRRMIVNKVIPPSVLNILGVKSWEWRLEDTMDMWSHTQWKGKASLDILTQIFGLESPKQDMDGSMVAPIYYEMIKQRTDELPFDYEDRYKAGVKRISNYCAGDIFAGANVYCRLKGFDIVTNEQVTYAE